MLQRFEVPRSHRRTRRLVHATVYVLLEIEKILTLRTIILVILCAGVLTRCQFVFAPVTLPATATPSIVAVVDVPATPYPTHTPRPTYTPTPTITVAPLAPTATLMPLTPGQREQLFDQVWTVVRNNYVYDDYNGLDWDAIRATFAPRVSVATTPEDFYQVLRAMIIALDDDHSWFESPQDVVAAQGRFHGHLEYGGIGAIMRVVAEGWLVTQLAREGPAAEAGLQPRDIVLAIDGVAVPQIIANQGAEALHVVRGPPGSRIKLTVRSVKGTTRQIEIIRRAIPASAFQQVEVERLPATQIGVLRIGTFNIDSLDQHVQFNLEQLVADEPLAGLIIDVRGNNGGRLDYMLKTLALFVDGGMIGSQRGRFFSADLVVPTGMTLPALAEVPLVVLIDPETISAAEMFTAGLQVLGRAQVVGMPSAGNTENLRAHEFFDGSRLWLAELAYHLPDGTMIEGQGIMPDQVVDVEWWHFAPADDPQLQAAVAELQRALAW